MPSAFVDTGAWIALMVPRDRHHGRATETFRNLPPRTRLITTNYVLAETVTWLVYHGHRQAAFRLKEMVEAAQHQSLLSLDYVSEAEHELAWSYIEQYQDQEFSFTDCTSFVVAGGRNVDFVFGFDEHFRAVGFTLRPGPG